MAIIPNFKITTRGVNLLNRVIAEQKTLKFTKFEIGDGSFTGDVKTLERLVSKFKEFAVIETNVLGDGQTNIKGYFDNKGFLTSKRLREFGVYAQIGDEILTEVLFSYTNAGDTADLIPAESENFFSRTLSVINKTDDVENVTFNVDLVNCKRDFNTVAELKAADWLIAGDKVNLWGNLVLGDVKKTSKIITTEKIGVPLLNGLYAKNYTSFLQDGGYKKDAARLNRDIVSNSGLLEDLEIEYIQDAGTKKNGYCYKDRNQQGIFKCFKDYTGTSNDANHFYKFDNNELLGKLQNLVIKSSKTIFNETLSPGQSTLAPNLDKYSDDTLFRAIAPNTTSTTDGNSSRTTMIISKGELKSGITMHIRGDAPNAQGNGIFIIWKLINGSIKNVTTAQDSGFTAPAILSLEELKISSI